MVYYVQEIGKLKKRIKELKDKNRQDIDAAKKLCQIYFEIAEECVGENEVRRRRDKKIEQALKTDSQQAPGLTKSSG